MTKKVKKSSFKNKYLGFCYSDSGEENQKDIIFRVSSDWTQTDTDALNTLIQNLTGFDVITILMSDYVQKDKYGKVFYNQKRSELVARIRDPHDDMTSAKASAIRKKLTAVKIELITGDWVSAYEELNEVVIDENDLSQEIFDDFELGIKSYINQNYPEEYHIE